MYSSDDTCGRRTRQVSVSTIGQHSPTSKHRHGCYLRRKHEHVGYHSQRLDKFSYTSSDTFGDAISASLYQRCQISSNQHNHCQRRKQYRLSSLPNLCSQAAWHQ
ncbi:hypothetical protein FOXG_20941 [Fusarium oxysporum f. sp. lycopersici 4287]|uniref:Uncharacterized protein n=1 Tax=Fusarium oxysporum f. sp. lycopersici (strain 4287 / CBS 123668 / FGSC 9935 / NRRL 34936) TaxID=426428 RepID=A0A0J9WS83_FUSO4|nr:hypothetical protein FOXG_20941 [Fusarium oxysporum f. sp. lycopersici 4287]EWZ79173.1 hypothetical protein FOWG_16624 [Fusarium oxysporum f. sp. lycopersici MN25]KNB13832.1 hypothetical protein FOXG_20941 [Fusarium oxysporum f. sp. lycopersici 4287]